MGKKLLKCSTFLVIRGMQISILPYTIHQDFFLIPIRMTKIKNSKDRTCWQGCEEGEHSSIAVRNTNVYFQSVEYKHSGNQFFSRKLGLVLPLDPDIALLDIYSKYAPPFHKDMCSTMLIAAYS